jgi:hypothetical protein
MKDLTCEKDGQDEEDVNQRERLIRKKFGLDVIVCDNLAHNTKKTEAVHRRKEMVSLFP